MKWLKAALVGVLGSLVMFAFLMVGIHVTGFAPFNLPPSAAFLEQLGLNVGPLPLLVHFGYGATWSIVLVALYKGETDVWAGLTVAGVLWIVMMLIYSPLIGWGVFGFGGGGQMAPSDPLYLGSPLKYIVATLLLHGIYGGIIGWLNPAWISFASEQSAV